MRVSSSKWTSGGRWGRVGWRWVWGAHLSIHYDRGLQGTIVQSIQLLAGEKRHRSLDTLDAWIDGTVLLGPPNLCESSSELQWYDMSVNVFVLFAVVFINEEAGTNVSRHEKYRRTLELEGAPMCTIQDHLLRQNLEAPSGEYAHPFQG